MADGDMALVVERVQQNLMADGCGDGSGTGWASSVTVCGVVWHSGAEPKALRTWLAWGERREKRGDSKERMAAKGARCGWKGGFGRALCVRHAGSAFEVAEKGNGTQSAQTIIYHHHIESSEVLPSAQLSFLLLRPPQPQALISQDVL
jgi:hypothetical protein